MRRSTYERFHATSLELIISLEPLNLFLNRTNPNMKIAAFLTALPIVSMAMEIPNVDIEASSKAGSKILSQARRLEGDNGDFSATWVSGYSLKFHS